MKSKLNKIITLAAFAAFSLHAENGRDGRPNAGGGAAVPVAPAAGGAAITTRSLKVSPFMMAPRDTWIPGLTSASPAVQVTEEGESLGFRVIHLKQSVRATKQAAVDLANSGLVESGDVFLSFRPEWDQTLAYAHMQLGVSHAALAFVVTENGQKFIHTLESPLNYSSPMNSTHHYNSLDAIHVIRTNLNATQKTNLSKWAKRILKNTSLFGFFSDYGKPYYKRGLGATTPTEQIAALKNVIISQRGKFDSYCSEFVWTVLGLRNCDPDALANGCESPIFGTGNGALTGLVANLGAATPGAQSRNAGLIQGPEAALTVGKVPYATKKAQLTGNAFKDILSDPDQLAGRMSSGHRAVAEANSGLMTKINTAYYAAGTEQAGEPAGVAAAINAQVVDNFSPTSFMIRSNAGLDNLKYVGTVVFDR